MAKPPTIRREAYKITPVANPGGISPDSDYFLCGACELLEITTDVAAWVKHANFPMDQFLDNFQWDDKNTEYSVIGYTRAATLELRKLFIDWYDNTANSLDRAFVGLTFLYDLNWQFKEFHWTVSDAVVHKHVKADNILNVDNIVGAIEGDSYPKNWADDVADSYQRAVASLQACDPDVVLNFCKGHIAEQHQIYEEYRERTLSDQAIPLKIPSPKTRSAIKKSIKLFSNVFGEKPLKAFLSGERVTVEGKLFNYIITKNQSIIATSYEHFSGHTPFSLEISDRNTNVVLCSACVYFKETPVLDQLIALNLYIKGGMEREFLEKANLSSRGEEYYNHPIIQEIKKATPKDKDIFVGALQNLMAIPDMKLNGETVTHDDWSNHIVPWRNRTRPFVAQALARYANIPEGAMMELVSNDINFDTLLTSTSMNHPAMEHILVRRLA